MAETKIKRGMIIKTILGLLAVGGLLTLAMVAPNAVQALTLFTGRPKRHYGRYIRSTIDRLIDRGLIRFTKSKRGKVYLQITDKGRRELLKYRLGELQIKKPKRWDDMWRVFIFDIKEYRGGDRDRLREELTKLGAVRLQNSVWVYPYDCEEFIVLLKSSFQLGRQLLYLVVARLENDKWLKQIFHLS